MLESAMERCDSHEDRNSKEEQLQGLLIEMNRPYLGSPTNVRTIVQSSHPRALIDCRA